MLSGSGDGYKLDQVTTRIEAAVMLVRLRGAERQVERNSYEHPFQDVPEWADSYVGYLYQNSYMKGLSESIFGTERQISVRSYLMMILRVLGYSESDNDFNWSNVIKTADDIGLLDEKELTQMLSGNLLRRDMVKISASTLNVEVKGTNKTLIKTLVGSRMVDEEKAILEE